MRSAAVLAFLAIVVAGVVATAVLAAADDSDMAFTAGVAPGLVAAEIRPGHVACQQPLIVAEAFDGVRIQVGTYHRPGPPLKLVVRRLDTGRSVASGRLSGGYPDISQPTVALNPTVRDDMPVAVCVRNRGKNRVAVYGGPELARRGSTTKLDGRDQRTDMTLVFTREPQSALATTPEIFQRAALFRLPWIGAWIYWLLLGLILLLVPAALALALRDAFDSRRG